MSEENCFQEVRITGWLPDRERLLIICAAGYGSVGRISSSRTLLWNRCGQVTTQKMNGSMRALRLDDTLKPSLDSLVDDQIERALADIDFAYFQKFPNYENLCGAPSEKVSNPLDDRTLRFLYTIGGFAGALEKAFRETDFECVAQRLQPILSLPVINDRKNDSVIFELPSEDQSS